MTYVIITRWTVRPGDEDAASVALERVAVASRAQPGVLAYRPLQQVDDPKVFLVYQEFVNREAFEAHHAGAHIADPELQDVIARLESRSRTEYELLT